MNGKSKGRLRIRSIVSESTRKFVRWGEENLRSHSGGTILRGDGNWFTLIIEFIIDMECLEHTDDADPHRSGAYVHFRPFASEGKLHSTRGSASGEDADGGRH